MNAVTLNARKSADHAAKLAETEALLTRASADYAPTTQASSLGAEDVVITHIIQRLGLTIPIFVLETGALHEETLALLARTQAAARLESPVRVYRPSAARVAAFETEHGPKAMYQSIELRKACCGIRKLEPLAQALAGHKAWVTGLRREQSGARAEVPAYLKTLEALVAIESGTMDAPGLARMADDVEKRLKALGAAVERRKATVGHSEVLIARFTGTGKRKLMLQGEVVLTRGENVVRGDRLDSDLATGVSTVSVNNPSATAGKPGQRVRALFTPTPEPAPKAP